MFRRVLPALTLLFTLIVCTSLTAKAQGFGTNKKKVILHRKLPAAVHLAGTAVKIQATARNQTEADVAQELHDSLEAEIFKDDKRLHPENAHPDEVIACTITSYSLPPPQAVQRPSGIPGKHQTTQTNYRVTGAITVAYQAKDRSGHIIDSDNISGKYDAEFDSNGTDTTKGFTNTISSPFKRLKGKKEEEASGPPNQVELRHKLLMKIVNQIASRIVNTDEPVEVYLARGKLDHANKLAESGLWNRDLEELETMPALGSKEEDAYRLYNIGVAYEALAYQASDDPKTARKFFEQAAIQYGKAIDANPAEKYFLEPQNRIGTAVAHYKKLTGESSATVSANNQASETVPSGSRGVSNKPIAQSGAASPARIHTADRKTNASAGSSAPPLTNQQVVEMKKAGVDDDNIIATIRSAPNVKFDVTVPGQIELAKNGVTGRILTAMRARASTRARAGQADRQKASD